jgi:hypothetical protein
MTTTITIFRIGRSLLLIMAGVDKDRPGHFLYPQGRRPGGAAQMIDTEREIS